MPEPNRLVNETQPNRLSVGGQGSRPPRRRGLSRPTVGRGALMAVALVVIALAIVVIYLALGPAAALAVALVAGVMATRWRSDGRDRS